MDKPSELESGAGRGKSRLCRLGRIGLGAARVLLRMVAVLLFAVCGTGWAIDPWLRPALVCRWPDGVWWWGAFAAGFVFVALAGLGRGGRPGWRSLGIACVAIVVALGALRWLGGRVSLFLLCHDEMIAAEPFAVGDYLNEQFT